MHCKKIINGVCLFVDLFVCLFIYLFVCYSALFFLYEISEPLKICTLSRIKKVVNIFFIPPPRMVLVAFKNQSYSLSKAFASAALILVIGDLSSEMFLPFSTDFPPILIALDTKYIVY